MMNYRVRRDVVLTQVCGEFLLVAVQSANKEVPLVQHINKTAALIWKRLENGADIDDLVNTIRNYFRIPLGQDHLEEDVRFLLDELDKAGYLIPE